MHSSLKLIMPGPEALTSCTCQGQELIFFHSSFD